MTAESRTLASATSRTALLSRRLEVCEYVVFRDLAPFQLPRDVAAQHVVELALQLDGKRDLGARKENPRQATATRHEDRRPGAQQTCRLVPELSNRADPHVATLVTIIRRRRFRGAYSDRRTAAGSVLLARRAGR